MDVLEERRAEIVAEVGPPRRSRGRARPRRRAAASAASWPRLSRRSLGFERAVEEEDAGGERVRQVVLGRVEDALAVRAEAAEGDAEGEAQVVGGGSGSYSGSYGGSGVPSGRSTAALRPVLGVAPRGGTGRAELDEGSRCDSCSVKAGSIAIEDIARHRLNSKSGKSIDVADLEVMPGFRALRTCVARTDVHQAELPMSDSIAERPTRPCCRRCCESGALAPERLLPIIEKATPEPKNSASLLQFWMRSRYSMFAHKP